MVGGKFYWLSASDTCQLWDDNLEPIHKFARGHVADVAWDHQGRNIALACKSSNQIVTTKFGSHLAEDISVIPDGDATALEFTTDSLIVGTSTGCTLLWDYNKNKLLRRFSGNERTPVHKLQVNNSIIAAGHSNGLIQIYGIKTGITTGQCSIPNSGGIRDLRFSSIKSSLMAAAFTSGAIAAWNTCSNKGPNAAVAEFTCAHQAPATSVALSPITDILMVSGGLDRNVILYDIPKKKILKKIETEAPVTAVEFFPDGTSLLVGTSKGKVFLYDLRSISMPAKTLIHHSSSVFRLLCRQPSQCPVRNSATNIKKTGVPIASTIENDHPQSSPLVSSLKTIDNDTTNFHSPLDRIKNLQISASTPGHTDAKLFDSGSITKDTEPRNSSLFSPLKGEASIDICSSPSLATSPLLKFNPRSLEDSVKSSGSFEASVEQVENKPDDGESLSPPVPVETLKTTREAKTPLPVKPTESRATLSASTMGNSGDFQAEFIKRIVHEVEDNLREVLRCRFGDLIVQSAQQFLTLQNELEQLKTQVQEKAYLEEEVRRLRQEVNHLRKLH